MNAQKIRLVLLGMGVACSFYWVVKSASGTEAKEPEKETEKEQSSTKKAEQSVSGFYQFKNLRSDDLSGISKLADDVKTTVLDQGLLLVGSSNSVARLQETFATADIPRRQIKVDAKLIDVTTDDSKESSVEWLADTLASASDQLAVEYDAGLNAGFVAGDFSFVYSALNESGRCKITSNPVLSCSEGESAAITFGEDRPIVTETSISDSGTVSSSYEYESIGQALSVKPYCGVSNTVQIAVVQSSSEVIGSTLIDGNEVPITSSRKLQTTVSCVSGEAVILGGLKKEVEENRVYSVPLLSSVPLVGRLFRSNSSEIREVELCVMLRPSVL